MRGNFDLTFFTDAKATDTDAWIGGFVQDKDNNILEWFSERLDKHWAPWLFVKRDLKRIIAALELLATLIAVRLWAPHSDKPGRGAAWVRAGTDNQSNSYAVSKMMSTKYPLTLLVMELSETLRTRNCELMLEWIPRERNQLADDLTNEKFDSFPERKRVKAIGGDTKWLVLERLMAKATEFFQELQKEKSEAKERPMVKTKGKKRKLEAW